MQYDEKTYDLINNSFNNMDLWSNMGVSLCLGNSNNYLFDEHTVNDYYDYLEEKELNHNLIDNDDDLRSNTERQWALESVEERSDNKTVICEQWLSDIHGVEMDDLFTRHTEVIYGEDILTFIDRLREGKRIMKQEGDADRWEANFELRLIALCEFAVEHDYGVRLSV